MAGIKTIGQAGPGLSPMSAGNAAAFGAVLAQAPGMDPGAAQRAHEAQLRASLHYAAHEVGFAASELLAD